MSESLAIELGSPLPLSITLPDGASGLFPRAVVYDSADAVAATRDLTEVGSTGRYTDAGFSPGAVDTFVAHYIVYTDAGHTTESLTYERVQDSLTVTDPATLILHANYDGFIHFDSVDGAAGAVLNVNGTITNPVSVAADLRTLLTSSGFTRVDMVTGFLSLTATSWSRIAFTGKQRGTLIVCTGATDMGGASFRDIAVIGTLTVPGTSPCSAVGGSIVNVTWPGGTISDADIVGTLTLSGDTGTSTILDNCFGVSVSGTPPILDVNSLVQTFRVHGYRGDLQIDNCTSASAAIAVELLGGTLTIDASCTAVASIVVKGVGTVVNNSALTVDTTALVPAGNAAAVWDSLATTHVTTGTMGLILQLINARMLYYVIDGGPSSANVTLDTKGLLLSGRVRLFADETAAAAATLGAANGADSELAAIDLTATNTGSDGMLANMTMISQ